jgi:hypothetical protein
VAQFHEQFGADGRGESKHGAAGSQGKTHFRSSLAQG